MNTRVLRLLTVACWLLPALSSPAATLYVDLNSPGPAAPYSTWATAATNIQAAVDAATTGDLVLVTNGVYQTGGQTVSTYLLTNRVAATIPVTIQSVNGPSVTVIMGYQVPGTTNGDSAVRCVYLTDGASLIGFTLAYGATRVNANPASEVFGGGVYCVSTNSVVSNCIIISNSASSGGGSCNGVLNNCALTGNSALIGAGGSYAGMLSNCVLNGNSALAGFPTQNSGGGGAVGSVMYNCILSNNSTASGGGGSVGATMNNCTVVGNYGAAYGGGVYGGILKNSLIISNTLGPQSAQSGLQAAGGIDTATLYNCTVIGNMSVTNTRIGGVFNCLVYNSIVCSNTAAGSAANYASSSFTNSCTTPLPPGSHDISADPQITDLYHLGPTSPCRGAGSATYATGTDIDGEPWLNPPSIGCDEYYGRGSLVVSLEAEYTNVAAGFTTLLTGEASGSQTGTSWDFGDGIVASNQPSVTHSWSVPGDYTVAFTAYNLDHPGGVSAALTMQVVVPPVYYVDLNSANPTPPFSSWATAAADIQDAVDAALVPGAMVLVTNGTYAFGGHVVPPYNLTNRAAISQPIILQSVNGPAVTTIQGYQLPGTTNGDGAVRCVWLADRAMMTGFTLTSGATRTNGNVTNEMSGGGVLCATTNSLVLNCVLIGNASSFSGGGAFGGTFNGCSLSSNSTFSSGAQTAGGGAADSTLNDCLVTDNLAFIGGGAYRCVLANCTVASNRASSAGGGAYFSVINNSIIFYNTATPPGFANASGTVNFSCTTPLPTSGIGNIASAPLFVSSAGGNFRLQSNSPCINAGNNAYVVGPADLDGNPRISGGTVDMGAYEFQNPASIISYAWLQQYGLATDGSADYVDSDHNGMNNWQKWVAGLNPTNAASVLQVLSPVTSGTNLVVTWQSVANISYFLQRSSSLAPGSFQAIVTNIAGSPGTTSYTDTNAPAPGPWFYRVGVP